jgi:hypothetical protein
LSAGAAALPARAVAADAVIQLDGEVGLGYTATTGDAVGFPDSGTP